MKTVSNPKEAFELIRGLYSRPEQEELFLLCFNAANGLKDTHLMAIGSDDCVTFPIKNIVKQAILDMAHRVIITHSHPSGNVRPSEDDIIQTKRLKEALDLLDIGIMDHLIVSGNKAYSFEDEEIIEIEQQN